MKPRRRVAVELGEKLLDAMGGALMNAHWLHPAADAAIDAAPPTSGSLGEKPENLRLSVALRTTEERPRPAVREPAQHHPNRELNLSKADKSVRHFGRDLA
jgi:hypothetical protein